MRAVADDADAGSGGHVEKGTERPCVAAPVVGVVPVEICAHPRTGAHVSWRQEGEAEFVRHSAAFARHGGKHKCAKAVAQRRVREHETPPVRDA